MGESIKGRHGEELRPGQGENDRPVPQPGGAPGDDEPSREAGADVGDERDTRTGD